MRIVEGLVMRRIKAWAETSPNKYAEFFIDRIHGTQTLYLAKT